MYAWILTILSALTGLVWLLDALWLRKRRRAALKPGVEEKPGFIVDFCVSFFPVIFAVFLLRSFIVEPFRIPSGSMIPTLHIGDFILVNKFAYGLRCPVGECILIDSGGPKRGDVVVFRYPAQSESDSNRGNDFIKRLIGLPGDHIHYDNKTLSVNGEAVKLEPAGLYTEDGSSDRLHETFAGVYHDIILNPHRAAEPFDYVVPAGSYFMMGDNRDGSYDSRYWGTVPAENLKGRAFFIWMSWDGDRMRPDFSRIGTIIH